MVLHARENFLDVAYTNCAAYWRQKACTGSESDVETIFEGFPFLVREDAAPVGEADRDGFVGAESLCAICGDVSLRMGNSMRLLQVSLRVQSRSPVTLPLMR